ncbi:MAG: DHA2 family efflux MFS transporter permease subunit [Devosia sp.]
MIRLTPLILAVALFMENMDSTVIATSLPAIASDIGSSPIALKLALTAYFVSLAVFIPISGWMADRFGATNIFRIAIGIFVLGSIACAFSNSLPTFVVSRFLQGIGGSMMTPVARLVLIRATPRNELVSAMAWLTVPALLGPLTGPPVGGFLTTYLSWHWIFWINVPIGLIGILLATRFLPPPEPRTPRPIDLIGFVLTTFGFSGVIFGLSVISLPAIPQVLGYGGVVIGAIMLVVYYFHTRRTEHPLLDPKLFRNRVFRTAVVGGSFFRVGIGAFPFLMPLMLQITFGLSPFESGLTTFVSAFGAIVSKFGATRLYARFGFPRVLAATSLLGCLFLAANGLFTPQTNHYFLMFVLFVGGLTRSFFFTGVNTFGYADIKEADASQATSIAAVVQQISVALGVAVAGGILEAATQIRNAPLDLFDFHIAWYIVAVLALISTVQFLRLPPDAGANVSGHRVRPMQKAEAIA